jgi:hypothetical protein
VRITPLSIHFVVFVSLFLNINVQKKHITEEEKKPRKALDKKREKKIICAY